MEVLEDNKVAKPLKVLSADRMLRKGIVATSFNDLQTKCKEKFNINDSITVVICMDEDGVEIDDEYYNSISTNATLMVLKQEEIWTPRNAPDAHSSQPSQHGQEIIAYIGKINTKKRKLDSSNGSERNSVPEKIKISPGWKHFSYKDNNYIQVRSRVNSPIPSGDILMSSTFDYQTTLKEMEKVYFPNGKSIKGKLSRMETSLGSSKGQLKPDGFTPYYFAKQLCSTQKPRLYLLSKNKIPDLFVTDDDDSSESSLPDPQLPPTCSSGLTPMVSSFISSDQVNPGPSFMFNATSSMCTTPTLATQSGGFSHCTLTPPAPAPNHDSFVVHAGTPTVEMMLPSTSRKGTICMDREVDAFVVPCGHSLCLVCGIHFHTNKKACPVCRGIIQDVKGIYFA